MGTTGQSITLANSIIGVGILAMPFCFQQCGVLLATLILLSMGLVSRLCCYFLLKSALLARRRNFEFLAFHVFGSAGKMAVELGIIGFLMGTCIAYFVVVGDLGPQIVAKMFNINQSDILRTSIMVIVSLVCVLPLGLLRNVDSLSNVSAATIGFYFCLVIKVITEAASQLLTVEWSTRIEMWKPQGVLQCVPIFSMALFCQTQLFEIFESMPTLSLEKMNVVTKNAINICTAVYFTLGLFGYIAFCKQDISGNILMSLSPTMASDVIKLGFVMSLAFSFPLIIFPCRASLYSFLYRKVHPSQHDHIINHSIPESTFRCITVAIIAMALFVSLLIPNIELVLGLVGSTIGVLICVVFPTACFVNVTFKNTNERVLAKVVLILGLVIMVLGTYANLQAAENSHDKYDDKYITQEKIDKMVEEFFESKKLENERIVIKPPEKVEPVIKEEVKINKDVIADSEVQPPNPIPPESQPVEKIEPPPPKVEETDKEVANKKKVKETPKEVKEDVDRVSETHPKNLNKIIDTKLANGEIKKEENMETPKKYDLKQFSNQQKIDILNQAQMMENIKQHDKEQIVLMKEQNEILNNILKTKKQLQNNEAKKVAVESIQKIANIAIQSLTAVSEDPVDPVVKNMEPVVSANEAVKKIADVAVEAIKEIKDKPIESAPVSNKESVEAKSINEAKAVPEVNKVNAVPVANEMNPVPVANELNPVPVQKIYKELEQNEPIAQNPIPPVQSVNNLSPVKAEEVISGNTNAKLDQQINNAQPKQDDAPMVNQAVVPPPDNIVDKLMAEQMNQNNPVPEKSPSVEANKEHSHSPDEPQSYKQGEDVQNKPLPQNEPKTNMLNNVPLPIAMNGNGLKSAESKQEIVKNPEILSANNAKDLSNNMEAKDNSIPVRQKREVVDCTNKASLRTEDKEICKSLVNSEDKVSREILPKVDLNDALGKRVDIRVGPKKFFLILGAAAR